jgi:hypothetical protein
MDNIIPVSRRAVKWFFGIILDRFFAFHAIFPLRISLILEIMYLSCIFGAIFLNFQALSAFLDRWRMTRSPAQDTIFRGLFHAVFPPGIGKQAIREAGLFSPFSMPSVQPDSITPPLRSDCPFHPSPFPFLFPWKLDDSHFQRIVFRRLRSARVLPGSDPVCNNGIFVPFPLLFNNIIRQVKQKCKRS